MPAWARVRSALSIAATALVTTAETVLVTSAPISLEGQTPLLTIWGMVAWTVGTGTTSATVRIRRGSLTGAAILTMTGVTVAAGNVVSIPFLVTDQPGDVADQVYVATVAQAAATANGTNLASGIAVALDV